MIEDFGKLADGDNSAHRRWGEKASIVANVSLCFLKKQAIYKMFYQTVVL